jgi:hypothetical protein
MPAGAPGPERRLVRTIEQAAVRLGAEAVKLGGATGAEREFYLSMGYRGRHPGGLMHKACPGRASLTWLN